MKTNFIKLTLDYFSRDVLNYVFLQKGWELEILLGGFIEWWKPELE